jgi:hypothetical protein
MTEATPSGASAPATPSDEPKAPVQQGTATQDQKDAPPPQGEAKPQPEPPKPTEPVKTEPPKPEAKVEFLSKSEQLKLPEKIAEAEAEYLKGKLEQFAKTAIENKMPLAEAQKAFENNLQSFRDVAAFGDARIQAMKNSWLDQIKGDKILGGDNLNRTNQLAERALVTLFGKDFYEKEMKGLYLINHPEAVRGLVKFAEAAGDASLNLGDKPTPPPEKPLTIGERVYGKNYNPMAVSPK